ncbi:MAG: MFS transporter [Bauldia sp.]|nr:MFS transporter [Bauldia sp.]
MVDIPSPEAGRGLSDGKSAPLDHAATVRIVIGVMMGALLGALDQTIVATALPTIGRELGGGEAVSWVVLAYLLTATVATPLFGKLSDIYGRRPALLTAIGGFIVGSVLCALAPTMLLLIVARGLQGIFGGALVSLAQTVIGDIVPPSRRGRYQGYIAAMFAAATIAGPALGGFFAEHFHWSSIFWINVPLGLVALVLTNRVLRRIPRHERRHSIDFLGAALMVTATVTLLLVLSWGGHIYAWSDWRIAALALASALFWSLFVLRSMRATEPLIPLELLGNRAVANVFAQTVLATGANFGLSVYMPIYYQLVLGLSAAEAGLTLIAMSASAMIGSALSGRYMTRSSRYKRPALVGLPVAAAACLALGLIPSPPLLTIILVSTIMGLGLGTHYPVTTISVQNAVLPYRLGTATGTLNFVRTLSGALMIAAFGAVVLSAAGPLMSGDIAALTADAALRGDLEASFRTIFLAAAACLAGGWYLLLRMREAALRTG